MPVTTWGAKARKKLTMPSLNRQAGNASEVPSAILVSPPAAAPIPIYPDGDPSAPKTSPRLWTDGREGGWLKRGQGLVELATLYRQTQEAGAISELFPERLDQSVFEKHPGAETRFEIQPVPNA